MYIIFLLTIVHFVSGEMCMRLLGNHEERRIIRRTPERILRWDSIDQQFVHLEALKMNGSAICSVDMSKNAEDLRGKTIIVAADLMNPYIMINADDTAVTGFIGDIWNILQETLKFKTIYRRAGLSAAETLMNGRAHALLVATVIYSKTSGYYTYSTPFATNSYALFVQSEGTRVSKWWYASIFSRGLWLTWFVFVVIITFAIMGIYAIKRNVCASFMKANDEPLSLSFDLLYFVGGISGQGFHRLPRSWSLRLIILSYLTMGMLMSCGFSSTLTSYLAIRGTSVPLSSLQDVKQKRTHSLCVRNDSSAYIHFTIDGSSRDELKPEWKGIVNKGCPDMRDSATLPLKLCQPGLAYLEAPDVFLPVYRQVQKMCRIVQMPSTYWSLRLAFLHARSSEHRRVIDASMMRLRSAGIFNYLEKKWISKEIESGNSPQWSIFQPVEFAHIHLAVLGLLIVAFVSAIICVVENIWYRLRRGLRSDRTMPIDFPPFDEEALIHVRMYNGGYRSRNFRRRTSLSRGNAAFISKIVKNFKTHEISRDVTIRVKRW